MVGGGVTSQHIGVSLKYIYCFFWGKLIIILMLSEKSAFGLCTVLYTGRLYAQNDHTKAVGQSSSQEKLPGRNCHGMVVDMSNVYGAPSMSSWTVSIHSTPHPAEKDLNPWCQWEIEDGNSMFQLPTTASIGHHLRQSICI